MSDDELPDSSVAVHVTMVSPSGNTSGASFVMDEIPSKSYANGVSNTTEFEDAFCASNNMFEGVKNSGDVVSTTVINWVVLAIFPL